VGGLIKKLGSPRRCLFFSEYQVYLVCRHSTWSEAVPFDPATNSVTELLNSSKLDSALFGIGDSSGWFRDRLEYSKRILTRETDALDAFRGILRRSLFITPWEVSIRTETSNINPNDSFALGPLWVREPSWDMGNDMEYSKRLDFPHADVLAFPPGAGLAWMPIFAKIHTETSQTMVNTSSEIVSPFQRMRRI